MRTELNVRSGGYVRGQTFVRNQTLSVLPLEEEANFSGDAAKMQNHSYSLAFVS